MGYVDGTGTETWDGNCKRMDNKYMGHVNGTGTDTWDMGTGQEQIYTQNSKIYMGYEKGTGTRLESWETRQELGHAHTGPGIR